ncbi:hypothetical protein SLS54_002693 [Diplodia seriata]
MFSLKVVLAFVVIQACLLTVPVKADPDFCDKLKDALGDGALRRRADPINNSEQSSVTGIVPSKCDWETGTQEDGEGKKACVDYCKGLFRDQDACNDSRCLAWNGGYELTGPHEGEKKDGLCYCTCGCPNIDGDE